MRFRIHRELRLEMSAMVFFSGLLLTILTINRYALGGSGPGSHLPEFFQDIDQRIGPWIIWVAFFGILLLLGGGWYFVDTIRKRREFRRLVETDSKAKFVRNQDRVEFLAWILGSDFQKQYDSKRQEFNLR